ncbi:MAG TPA: hypothetical protein VFA18_10665 [Gemmataceae bacterium]|nr:hypothetical protein [Gemmataceae bacterium]
MSRTVLAGLEKARAAEVAANPAFAQNWSTAQAWSERSRYERHSLAKAQAAELHHA